MFLLQKIYNQLTNYILINSSLHKYLLSNKYILSTKVKKRKLGKFRGNGNRKLSDFPGIRGKGKNLHITHLMRVTFSARALEPLFLQLNSERQFETFLW